MTNFRGQKSKQWGRFRRRRVGGDGSRRFFVTAAAVLVVAAVLYFSGTLIDNLLSNERDVVLGATFSKKYAAEMDLDWRQAYLATLDDLGVRALRIPVYWDDIERSPGRFDFSDVDWQLSEARKRGAKVILAVGMKLPRWPECHLPDWAADLDEVALKERTVSMLRRVVAHFSTSTDFFAWQVENEPLFPYGECPPPDRELLEREVEVVRAADDRPVIITESGELSDWVRSAVIADRLGISTYRSVWNRYIGHFYWPTTPRWYSGRIAAVSGLVDEVFVSELQAEPWAPGPIIWTEIDFQLSQMNPERLRGNVSFVRRMGVRDAYLWGVEWWYWLKEQGHPELWDAGRELFGGPDGG
ncbi:MAG: cellulase family glycosylhydrolase [bacterium]